MFKKERNTRVKKREKGGGRGVIVLYVHNPYIRVQIE